MPAQTSPNLKQIPARHQLQRFMPLAATEYQVRIVLTIPGLATLKSDLMPLTEVWRVMPRLMQVSKCVRTFMFLKLTLSVEVEKADPMQLQTELRDWNSVLS